MSSGLIFIFFGLTGTLATAPLPEVGEDGLLASGALL